MRELHFVTSPGTRWYFITQFSLFSSRFPFQFLGYNLSRPPVGQAGALPVLLPAAVTVCGDPAPASARQMNTRLDETPGAGMLATREQDFDQSCDGHALITRGPVVNDSLPIQEVIVFGRALVVMAFGPLSIHDLR